MSGEFGDNVSVCSRRRSVAVPPEEAIVRFIYLIINLLMLIYIKD